jgi:hypothetical protein
MSGPPGRPSPVPQVPAAPYRPAPRGGTGPSRASARDFSPEKPIGRLPAPASQRGLWIFVLLIAGGFIGVVALIIIVSKLVH